MERFLKTNKKKALQYIEDSSFKEKFDNFSPILINNFETDTKIFSEFWKSCNEHISNFPLKNKRNEKEKYAMSTTKSFCDITRKIFLRKYSSYIYSKLTNNMSKFIDLDDLVYNINVHVPHITPSQKEINIENIFFLLFIIRE